MSSAQRTVGTLSSQWELHAWHQCREPGDVWTFSDRGAALSWLKRFKSDPISIAGIRSAMHVHGVGLSPRQKSDDQLLDEVSWLLRSGVLHVHRVIPRRTAWRTGESESSTAAEMPAYARPTVSSPASPAPKPTEEADTFSAQTDAQATAAGLCSAAVSGVPFCEECAKAASTRQAA